MMGEDTTWSQLVRVLALDVLHPPHWMPNDYGLDRALDSSKVQRDSNSSIRSRLSISCGPLHPPGICEFKSYRWFRIKCTYHAGMMPSIMTSWFIIIYHHQSSSHILLSSILLQVVCYFVLEHVPVTSSAAPPANDRRETALLRTHTRPWRASANFFCQENSDIPCLGWWLGHIRAQCSEGNVTLHVGIALGMCYFLFLANVSPLEFPLENQTARVVSFRLVLSRFHFACLLGVAFSMKANEGEPGMIL